MPICCVKSSARCNHRLIAIAVERFGSFLLVFLYSCIQPLHDVIKQWGFFIFHTLISETIRNFMKILVFQAQLEIRNAVGVV